VTFSTVPQPISLQTLSSVTWSTVPQPIPLQTLSSVTCRTVPQPITLQTLSSVTRSKVPHPITLQTLSSVTCSKVPQPIALQTLSYMKGNHIQHAPWYQPYRSAMFSSSDRKYQTTRRPRPVILFYVTRGLHKAQMGRYRFLGNRTPCRMVQFIA
jgi:hypothetical protein